MKRTVIAIAVAVVLVGCGDSEKSRPTGPTSPAADVSEGDMAALVKGNNQFALDLYGQIGGESGNLFLSPYSISAALAMAYAGARGETADEMAGALRLGLDQDRLPPAYQSLLYRLHGRGGRGYELSAANRLWGQAGYAFDPDYLNLTLKHYGAELATVDFVGKTDAARRAINAWVEDQTNDKIKDLIEPGVLDAMTRLVLTNAIYFKGNWDDEFEKDDTHDALFHLNDEKDVEVRMMYREGRYRYAKKDGLAVLSIPYKGNDLSMMILLPDEVEGVGALEGQLTLENIAWWESGLAWDEVHVYLPKFRFSARFSLAEVLEALGMERAFSAHLFHV